MEFISEELDQYISVNSAREPAILARLNRETHLKMMQPRMLSGHFQGRVLSMLSSLVQPKCILEIGTYTGYSALCLAEGLANDGMLHTIDINEERAGFVNHYIQESGFQGRIIPHVGNALTVIPAIEGNFDLVFIDADKENYLAYYHLVIDRVRSGGLIIADNVLWSGKVLEPVKANDKETMALLEYNRVLSEDSRVEVLILPVRDGLSLARKR
jgi:caffeoyl-CoA O-methyltransferase